jgi:hypothetical protein
MQINKPITDAVFWTEIWFKSAISGNKGKLVSADELERFNRDPDGFAASEFGMTVVDYREWIALGGMALCGGMTRAGMPCSTSLAGMGLNPADWRALHREEYCKQHGGAGSVENRKHHSASMTCNDRRKEA